MNHRLFAAQRADIECFARDMEARGRARATITRRLCTIAGFYRYGVPISVQVTNTTNHNGFYGTLSLIDSTDFSASEPAIVFPDSFSDFHDFADTYTVG